MVPLQSLVLLSDPVWEFSPVVRVCSDCADKVKKELQRQEIVKLEKDFHPEDRNR
jgi:hypothetical protein